MRKSFFTVTFIAVIIMLIITAISAIIFETRTKTFQAYPAKITWDGKLNKETRNGYTHFKYIGNAKYYGYNVTENACPQGTYLPDIEDLTAVYCEAKGENAVYTDRKGKQKNCSSYTYNANLANVLEKLFKEHEVFNYNNEEHHIFSFWTASTIDIFYEGSEDGRYAMDFINGRISGENPDAAFNVICLGK